MVFYHVMPPTRWNRVDPHIADQYIRGGDDPARPSGDGHFKHKGQQIRVK